MKSAISNSKNYILFLAIITGLALRVYSINYGLAYIVGPDEKRQILDALSMGARGSLLPLEYTYPALHKYLLLFCFGAYFVTGYILRIFLNISDFLFKFIVDPGHIFLIGRLLSVLFGMLLAIPVYLLGKSLVSRNIATIACILAMFMSSLVTHSQWAIADIVLAFWSTWAFYYILRCALIGSSRDFIFSGIFMGLATATKYQGIYLIVPFFVMGFLNRHDLLSKKSILQKIFPCLALLMIFAALGNLGFIFKFKESTQRFLELKDEIMGISSTQPFAHNFFSVAYWFIKELIRQELTLGVVLLSGILYSLYRRSKIDLIFLSYIFVCLFSLVNFGFRYLHLLVYSFAIICVFAAISLERFAQLVCRDRYKFSYSLILACFMVAPSLNTTFRSDIKRSNPDTRMLAKAWVEQNIPAGANIAEDWYDFSVPLQTDSPWIFQDGKLKAYYVKFFPEDLKRKFISYASRKKIYNLSQIKYDSQEPIWPAGAPEDFLKRARTIPLIVRLYRWFNFYSLEELRSKGVSYVIISSYSYNHFLLDDDIHKKTGLFNLSITEDGLSSNRQAGQYLSNTKYGLLFYLAKRARDFYLPLLNLSASSGGITEIKEISPGQNNLGPVIKIYHLE